ncbi:MAG: tRNA dihydrouridine(20/20a) synthase DusA [Gammaproteobacteria bacterium]
MIERRLSIAPMLDWTDRYCRYFLRLITRHTLLYTEMVTTGAILHGERSRFLDFDPSEHPLALQLGGSEPGDLARCARLGEQWGYDEINLNVGCPSDKVQSGSFGACLMLTPAVVADGVKAMCDAVAIEVTVKHRIGVDEQDSYSALCDFVGSVAEAGCRTFIVHARKAWLQGLSPKENREIPPLSYDTVHRLKTDFPALQIVINGGIKTLQHDHSSVVRIYRDPAQQRRLHAARQTPGVSARRTARLQLHPVQGDAPHRAGRHGQGRSSRPPGFADRHCLTHLHNACG